MEIFIGLGIVAALVVYLIASHKIDVAKIDTKLAAGLASLEKQIGLTHAAALSVMAVPASPTATIDSTTAAIIGAAGGGGGGGGSAGSPIEPIAPVNDSDPTAPGFVPPANPAPAPAAPPTEPAYTPDPHNLDFVRDAQLNVPVTDYAHLTVPEGWAGRLLVQTNVRPGTQPYSTTLNGAYRHAIDIPNNNNPYWLAYGVPPQPGDIPMADRVVRLDVQQPAGSTVVFDFQPQAA